MSGLAAALQAAKLKKTNGVKTGSSSSENSGGSNGSSSRYSIILLFNMNEIWAVKMKYLVGMVLLAEVLGEEWLA